MPDFTYTESNGYVMFVPENDQAIEIWNVFSDFTNGTGKFLKTDLKNIKAQLKAKGYSVKKVALKSTKVNDDNLLSELFS